MPKKDHASFAALHKNAARDLDAAGKSDGQFKPRLGSTKSYVGDWTSPVFKDLLPGRGKLRGVALTWQRSTRAFHGYYADATPGTVTASFGGPRAPADPVVALALHRKKICDY